MIQPTHSPGLPHPGSLRTHWKELFLMTKLDTIVNAVKTQGWVCVYKALKKEVNKT